MGVGKRCPCQSAVTQLQPNVCFNTLTHNHFRYTSEHKIVFHYLKYNLMFLIFNYAVGTKSIFHVFILYEPLFFPPIITR